MASGLREQRGRSGLAGRSVSLRGRARGRRRDRSEDETELGQVGTATLEGERGAVAVEFAIISTVLFLILFGIVAFGLAYSKYEVYVGAAREGARYAAVRCVPDSLTGCTNTLIQTKVTNTAVGYPIGGSGGGTSPTEDIVCSGSTIGQSVTVSWVQPITLSVPFWKTVTVLKTMKAVFRCE
jgi:Flp pilus assembly protein TadG